MNRTLAFFAILISTLILSSDSLRAQWVKIGPDEGFGSLDSDPGGLYLYAHVGSGMIRSADLGVTWDTLSIGDADLVFLGGGEMVAGTPSGTIWKSSDYGDQWDSISNSMTRTGITSLCYDSGQLFAGTRGYGVFLSTDSGRTWDPINNSLANFDTTDSVVDFTVTALAVNDGYLFAGTGDQLEGGVGILRSKVGTYVWGSVDPTFEETIVTGFSAIGPIMFASTRFSDGDGGVGVYRSSDSGASWLEVGFQPPYQSVTSLLFASPYLISGHENFGVFISADSGGSWQPSPGLPAGQSFYNAVDGLAFERGFVFAGISSGGSGLYRRPLSDFGASFVNPDPQVNYSFVSNPNPFSQSTTISFTSETGGYAEISVVNLLGAEVAHVFSGMISSGTQRFRWEPTGLPDGLYECLLRMNGQVEKLPVLLLH